MRKRKLKVYNNYNVDSTKATGELNTMESRTIPNQSYSMTELMQRFARGEHLPIGKPVYYDGTDETVTEESIDPTLRPDYDISDAHRDLKDVSRRIQEREKEKAKKYEETNKKNQKVDKEAPKEPPESNSQEIPENTPDVD